MLNLLDTAVNRRAFEKSTRETFMTPKQFIQICETLSAGKLKVLTQQFKDLPIAEISEAFDPSNNGEYTTWILRMVQSGNLIHPEDASKTREALDAFTKLKRTGTINADINSYKSFSDLYNTINSASFSKREMSRHQQTAGAETVYDKNGWTVDEITTPSASATLCKGTAWCVKDPRWATNYLRNAPLYRIQKDGENVALCHFDGSKMEIKDTSDDPLPLNKESALILELMRCIVGDSVFGSLEMAVSWSLELNKELPDKVRHRLSLSPYLACKYALARNVRWPEIEDSLINGFTDANFIDIEAYAKQFNVSKMLDIIEKAKDKKKAEKNGDGAIKIIKTLKGDWSVIKVLAGRAGNDWVTRNAVFAFQNSTASTTYILAHKGKPKVAIAHYNNSDNVRSSIGKGLEFCDSAPSYIAPLARAMVEDGVDNIRVKALAATPNNPLTPSEEEEFITNDDSHYIDMQMYYIKHVKGGVDPYIENGDNVGKLCRYVRSGLGDTENLIRAVSDKLQTSTVGERGVWVSFGIDLVKRARKRIRAVEAAIMDGFVNGDTADEFCWYINIAFEYDKYVGLPGIKETSLTRIRDGDREVKKAIGEGYLKRYFKTGERWEEIEPYLITGKVSGKYDALMSEYKKEFPGLGSDKIVKKKELPPAPMESVRRFATLLG